MYYIDYKTFEQAAKLTVFLSSKVLVVQISQ